MERKQKVSSVYRLPNQSSESFSRVYGISFNAIFPLHLYRHSNTLLERDCIPNCICITSKGCPCCSKIDGYKIPKRRSQQLGSAIDNLRMLEGGPWLPGLLATLDECSAKAASICKHGVSSVKHDEPSGSCSYSCFQAPNPSPRN